MVFGKQSLQRNESNRRHADGVREKNIPRIATLGLLEKIQSLMRDLKCELEHSKDRIIFMSMYNDIEWGGRGNPEICEHNSQTVASYARKYPRGHWSFLGPGSEKKFYGTYSDKPDGAWDKTAGQMMLNFAETSHPVVRASSAFERGELKSKGGGKKSIHFNGSSEHVELLLRMAISANQLSVYGAVADLCRELSKDTTASGKLQAHDPLETMKMPIDPPTADPRTDELRRGNLLQEYEQKFEQLSDNQKLSKLCSNGSLKTIERGQYFITLDTTQGPSGMVHLCREYMLPRNDPRTRARGWIRGNTKIGPVLNIHVCHHEDRYCTEIQVSASRQNHLLSSNCEWT